MKYLRAVDDSAYQSTGLPGFDAQFLAVTESAAVVMGRIGCGGAGPALHIHPCDQYYFMCSGRMRIRLGHEVQDAGPGSLVCIPAGVPHCNWNDGPVPEVHLELLAPTTRPGQPHFTFVDAVDDVPPVSRKAYVSTLSEPGDSVPDTNGKQRRQLSHSEPATASLRATVVESASRTGQEQFQVSSADQLAFVLDGAMEVSLGPGDPSVATAPCLVIIPAGVPHRLRNAAAGTVRYLEILLPDADGTPPRGQFVSLSAVGPSHLL
jgi:mannose-6-phosphate isomerase-like protein (cupin superfamily)